MSKFTNFKKPSTLSIVVISSIVLFYVLNYLFLPRYFNPMEFQTERFTQIINHFSVNGNLLDLVRILSKQNRGPMYPPLYFINLLFPLYVFGKSWVMMVVTVNTFYLLMLLVFTYLLAKELLDEKAGLIAAVLVSLCPVTWVSYRLVSMEFPLIGLAAMSVYFLHRSKDFSILKWSVLAALSCAWGMWTKEVFGAFVVGPILYVFYRSIMNSSRNRDVKPVLNFLAFAITFYAVIHPFYFVSLGKLNSMPTVEAYKGPSVLSWYSFENIKPFLYSLWEAQLGFPLFIVFIAGVWYFFRSMMFRQTTDASISRSVELKIMLLLWIIIPVFMLLFIPRITKPARYLIPDVSALAVISAFLVRRIIDKKLGLLIFMMLICFGIFRYYKAIFNNESMVMQHVGYLIPVGYLMPDYSTLDEMKLSLIDEIKKMRMHDINKKRFVVSTINNYFVDYRTFLWFNGIEADNVQEICSPAALGYLKEPVVWFKMLFRILDNSDFLIVFYSDQPPDRYDFETIKSLFLSDPDTYKTFDWGKYKPVFEEKMSKFKVRQMSSIAPRKKPELYIKYRAYTLD